MDSNNPPAVPAGWTARWNDQYKTWFYVDLSTKQSQWDLPTAPTATAAASAAPSSSSPTPQTSGAGDLPAGWVSRFNEQYQTEFFVNTQTKQSQWDRPTAPATPAAGDSQGMPNMDGLKISTPQPQGPAPTAAPAPAPAPAPAADNQPGAPEVPAGWTARFNEQYQAWFYVNLQTKQSQWDKPTAPTTSGNDAHQATSPQQSSQPATPATNNPAGAPEVPSGWAARYNDQYQTWFYVNTITKQSQWDKPTAPVQPTHDAQQASSPHQASSSSPHQASQTAATPATNNPADAPEVPSGWAARFNDQYQVWFYVNTFTKKSQWDKPTSPATPPVTETQTLHTPQPSLSSTPQPPSPAPPANSAGDAPEVPAGWVARFNDQYHTWFYVNTATKQSQWDKPTAPITPAPETHSNTGSPAPAAATQHQPQPARNEGAPFSAAAAAGATQPARNESSPVAQQPQSPTPAQPVNDPNSPPPVPAGWITQYNEQYQTWFYVNSQTHQPQWDLPTQPVIAPNAGAGAAPGQRYYSEDEELARKLQAEEDAANRR